MVMRAETPANFFAALAPEIRDDILSRPSAQQRLQRLAELVHDTPVPRSAIVFAALNKNDPMRRIRADKSRKHPSLGDMVCLSERYDKELLSRLGTVLPADHFYFVTQATLDALEPSLE